MKGSEATYRVLIGVFGEVKNRQAAEAVMSLVPPIAQGRRCHCCTKVVNIGKSDMNISGRDKGIMPVCKS